LAKLLHINKKKEGEDMKKINSRKIKKVILEIAFYVGGGCLFSMLFGVPAILLLSSSIGETASMVVGIALGIPAFVLALFGLSRWQEKSNESPASLYAAIILFGLCSWTFFTGIAVQFSESFGLCLIIGALLTALTIAFCKVPPEKGPHANNTSHASADEKV